MSRILDFLTKSEILRKSGEPPTVPDPKGRDCSTYFLKTFGTRRGNRTPDRQLKRLLLYLAELCAHIKNKADEVD